MNTDLVILIYDCLEQWPSTVSKSLAKLEIKKNNRIFNYKKLKIIDYFVEVFEIEVPDMSVPYIMGRGLSCY